MSRLRRTQRRPGRPVTISRRGPVGRGGHAGLGDDAVVSSDFAVQRAQVITPGNPGRRASAAATGRRQDSRVPRTVSGTIGTSTVAWWKQRSRPHPGPAIANHADRRLVGTRDRVTRRQCGALELSASFSRTTGNVNLPAEYAYRKFLAFRGFGGPGLRSRRGARPVQPLGHGPGRAERRRGRPGELHVLQPLQQRAPILRPTRSTLSGIRRTPTTWRDSKKFPN